MLGPHRVGPRPGNPHTGPVKQLCLSKSYLSRQGRCVGAFIPEKQSLMDSLESLGCCLSFVFPHPSSALNGALVSDFM